MNYVRWKNLSLKYRRFTQSGGKNKGIRKSEFVAKTQFLFFISSKFTTLQRSLINIESIESFKVTVDIISILIHNNTLQFFFLINIRFPILKTVYFHLWLLTKINSCISIASETMEKWRFQRYYGHATLCMEGHLKLRMFFIEV